MGSAIDRVWPHLRAAIIALAIAVGLLEGWALPSPRQAARVSPAAERAAQWAERTRGRLLAPLRPVFDTFDVTERWRLFPVADRERFRMVIEAATGPNAPWEVVYRVHDPAHQRLADLIEYRRFRGVWNPGGKGPRSAYGAFCTWVAREILRREARFTQVRVRMEKIRVLPGSAGIESTGAFVYPEVRTRKGLGL